MKKIIFTLIILFQVCLVAFGQKNKNLELVDTSSFVLTHGADVFAGSYEIVGKEVWLLQDDRLIPKDWFSDNTKSPSPIDQDSILILTELLIPESSESFCGDLIYLINGVEYKYVSLTAVNCDHQMSIPKSSGNGYSIELKEYPGVKFEVKGQEIGTIFLTVNFTKSDPNHILTKKHTPCSARINGKKYRVKIKN